MASKMMIALAAAFLGSASADIVEILPHGNLLKEGKGVDAAFQTFIQNHGREYKHGSAEHELRKGLFTQRLAAVHAQNAQPGRLWEAGLDHFSDRTEAERKAVLGYRRHLRASPWGQSPASFLQMHNQTAIIRSQASTLQRTAPKLPKSKDWTETLKCAQPAPDQGSCGSCWAVATMSTLQAHDEIYNGKTGTRTFSGQQIIECTPNPRSCGGTGGCEGATVELGMDYAMKNGLVTAKENPYRGQDRKCTAAQTQTDGGLAFGLMNYRTLKVNDDQDLAATVANVGPVGVSACAGAWFGYSQGIFNGCNKDCTVDHAITLFGYGEEGGKKFWKIRNSWGPSWGEKGYIRLLRQNEGETHCGTDHNMQEGVGCKGDPTSAPICGSCGVLSDSVVPVFKGSPVYDGTIASDHTSTQPTLIKEKVLLWLPLLALALAVLAAVGVAAGCFVTRKRSMLQ